MRRLRRAARCGGRRTLRPMPDSSPRVPHDARRGAVRRNGPLDPARLQISRRRLPGTAPREDSGRPHRRSLAGSRRGDCCPANGALSTSPRLSRRERPRGICRAMPLRALRRGQAPEAPRDGAPERTRAGSPSHERARRIPCERFPAASNPAHRRRGDLRVDGARVRVRARRRGGAGDRGVVLRASFARRRGSRRVPASGFPVDSRAAGISLGRRGLVGSHPRLMGNSY